MLHSGPSAFSVFWGHALNISKVLKLFKALNVHTLLVCGVKDVSNLVDSITSIV